jgi:hypothetical protein
MTRVQADILPGVRAWLDSKGIGAAVRGNVPPKWTPADGALLIVADDGGPALWPIKSKHTIRLTGWAAGRTEARRIVTLAAGKLAESRPRPPGVAHVNADMGAVLDGRDKDTGAMLASVLITAHARMIEA